MKKFTVIMFSAGLRSPEALRRMLAATGIPRKRPEVKEIHDLFVVRLPSDDPRTTQLMAYLGTAEVDPSWSFRVEVLYEPGDLQECEFVHLHVNRAARGDTGPMYDTEYDVSAGCPACGTGSRQISPLRISSSAVPKKGHALRTHHGEVLLHNDLATDLMVALNSERGLVQAEERRSRRLLPWWQILPDLHMPPAHPLTGHRVGWTQCPHCRRNGFAGPVDQRPLEWTYVMALNDRLALPDFVYTWEHFGTSRIKWQPGQTIGFAHPAIIVSNRVLRTVWEKRAKEVVFTPVRFLEPQQTPSVLIRATEP
jgi:hypothetical protein